MHHLQCGMKSPLKFAPALSLLPLKGFLKTLFLICLPLAPPHHLPPPSDCPRLRFGPCDLLCVHYKCLY